jgi:hypothetical protein
MTFFQQLDQLMGCDNGRRSTLRDICDDLEFVPTESQKLNLEELLHIRGEGWVRECIEEMMEGA